MDTVLFEGKRGEYEGFLHFYGASIHTILEIR